ncbi:MAG: primosomal protein N' [Bacteroidota bacterium]
MEIEKNKREVDTYFADVILPFALPNYFTYSVPLELIDNIKVGQRVVVQFGKAKLYTALVYNIHSIKPQLYKAKPIESILDIEPIVNKKQFDFWKWIADYYLCTIGDVMNAALPSGLKLSSETKILLSSMLYASSFKLSEEEILIYETLKQKETLTIDELAEIVNKKSVHTLVKSLLEKGIILVNEKLKEKFKPKIDTYVRLTSYSDNEENLKKIFDKLEKKAFKQLEILMEFIRLSDRYSKTKKEVKKSELLKKSEVSFSVINELVRKNIFEFYEKENTRLAAYESSEESKILSEEQQQSLRIIKDEWKNKDVVLFHGVTSSGKTEIYVKLIEETLQQGKQVLYLLPEIALTTQITNRIIKYFGDKIGVYHSRFNENERVEVWNKVLKFQGSDSTFQIILGARSAIFLPYSNLGLIIVDEEHDSSYKQFDKSPQYNARDASIMLAKMHGAKVLLGSATPSLESYYNAQKKKYGFVQLLSRFSKIQMPEILVADIKEASKRKQMKSHFSPLLLENIQKALANKEQVILFQNRRGFSPYLECYTCGWIPQCKNCDVSLVFHKTSNQLRCHYCGYSINPPSCCAACGDANIKMKSFGTEKIEEDIQIFFPDASIARMDLDSTRSRFSYQQIISNFEEHNIDILVGTQMVTKGLDFDNVSTVGILHADIMMNFPDFRSHERSFQLMAQVSGRAGRKNKRGKVIIQAYSHQHPIIRHVINNDYSKMYEEELEQRKNFRYPPFYRLIELMVIDKELEKVYRVSDELAKKLKAKFGNRVLGPEFPLIARMHNKYRKKILLKISRDESVYKAKSILTSLLNELKKEKENNLVRIQIDVDPM